MSKEKSMPAGGFGGFIHELFQFGIYKRNQGRVTRQVTFAAILVTTLLGAWSMSASAITETWLDRILPEAFHGSGLYFFPGLVLFAGIWMSYRLVNMPKFADFLIAVEAEMNKVSWPSRGELYRSSAVVIFVIFVLAAVLYCFDLIWQFVFRELLQIIS